jgi:hypothetical protein
VVLVPAIDITGDNHEVVEIGELRLLEAVGLPSGNRRSPAVHRYRALVAEGGVDVDARKRKPRKQLALEDPGQ